MRSASWIRQGWLLAAFTLTVFSTGAFATSSSLRDQLALAEKDKDALSQIELLRRILDKEPQDSEANRQLVHLWLDVEDYDMAEKALAAWKDAPANERASVTAEILYYRDDEDEKAVSVLEDYRKQNPADIEITRQEATYLTEMKDYARVVKLLSEAQGVDRDPELLISRATAKRFARDFHGALQDYALAEKTFPESSIVSNNKATFERLEGALPHIEAASAIIEKTPGDFNALLARAYWYYFISTTNDLAAADAAAALKLQPGSSAATILYAMAANGTGELTTAKAREKYLVEVSKSLPDTTSIDRLLNLDNLIAKEPSNAKALAGRAFVLNDTPAQYRLALKDADAALALEPKNVDAHLEKMYALVKLGETSDALAALPDFEATKPSAAKLATANSYVTDAAFAASDFQHALEFSTRAIALNPTAQYYKQRAAVYQRLNRQKDAEADLAKAAKLEKK